MQLKTACEQGAEILRKADVPSPRLTAEVLLMHAAKCDRVHLHAHGDRNLTELEWIHYGRYLNERLKGKPTQYITGKQEFWGMDFIVNPSVLIPRPETELLVEATIELARLYFGGERPLQIADVGTGSGCIAVAIAKELPASTIYAFDQSAEALATAQQNSTIHGTDNQIRFRMSDLLRCANGDPLPLFDFIVSNPPYIGENHSDSVEKQVIEYEPHDALFAGPTGTEVYDRLINQAGDSLRPGGFLAMELGYDSEEWMRSRLDSANWSEVRWLCDLAGIMRVVTARRRMNEETARSN